MATIMFDISDYVQTVNPVTKMYTSLNPLRQNSCCGSEASELDWKFPETSDLHTPLSNVSDK